MKKQVLITISSPLTDRERVAIANEGAGEPMKNDFTLFEIPTVVNRTPDHNSDVRAAKDEPTECRMGVAKRIGREWIGWSGCIASPKAPLGGGGLGNFAPAQPWKCSGGDLHSPWQRCPLGMQPNETQLNAPKPASPPPTTVPRSIGVIKEIQSVFVDYKIEGAVIADGAKNTSGAVTDFTVPEHKSPEYDHKDGKITKFNGKFTFRGTIQIQTFYSVEAKATGFACYGRGTTERDIEDRNITLGFHESCHRADYTAYLKANDLPDPPEMRIGMSADEYEKAARKFKKSLKQFISDMKADSKARSDEVGFTLSHSDATNSCYSHELPE